MGVDTNKIRTLRIAKGLTMAAVAQLAGMRTAQQWNGVESGERKNPSIDTVQRMAKALGVKVDALLK
ncbi:MAG TPA: helix-turn-helix transcriptional regulator [Tepidisphaeraceae bacterium]|jgi:transcriptional regulator with XRE-family HTH domain|nr:helix-turn-helix transcriptional regulator [Tepidisphaeraceae bacterium]